jgi:large subunit ribosomal protein L25
VKNHQLSIINHYAPETMSTIVVQAKKRETGKKASKAVRNSDLIPGVFYAKGTDVINIATTHKQLKPVVYTAKSHVINLEVEGTGTAHKCILKDISFDPVTDAIVHFDLLGLIDGHKVIVNVPIVLKGQAKGVMSGAGLMEHLTHNVKIECLPDAIPEQIEMDVTSLDVGQSLHVRDINIPGVQVLRRPETLIAVVNRRKVRGSDNAAPEGKK